VNRLAGKVALVTGGARGIGRSISELFAAEGASVVLIGRSGDRGQETEAAIRQSGGEALFVQTDVSDDDQVHRAVDAAVDAYGSLTVLVNNAGGTELQGRDGPVGSVYPRDWQEILSVDLNGVFHACRHAIPRMLEAGGGSIVTIGSTTATIGQAHCSAYSTAKAAVSGLMRTIAVDYGPQRIRANTIQLGLVAHDGLSFLAEGDIGKLMLSVHALPFLGECNDAAMASLYLASDEAKWVTGAELSVNGGASRLPPWREAASSAR
jgi:NAD(P)-dependent dehydrogenase (short-subunit alcohol dehydrogenase family)